MISATREMGYLMMVKNQRWILFLFCAVLSALLGVSALVRPARIWYHRTRMEVAWRALCKGQIVEGPSDLRGFVVTEAHHDYVYHLNRLGDLGYFFHDRYRFDKIAQGDRAHSVLWREVRGAFPESPHVTLSYRDNTLEVWDFPNRRAAWNTFYVTNNRAHFARDALSDSNGLKDTAKGCQDPREEAPRTGRSPLSRRH
jgi:hypothetical protein